MAAEEKGVQANASKESTEAGYKELEEETEDKLRECAKALNLLTAKNEKAKKKAVEALRGLLNVELINELKEKKIDKKNQNKGITTKDIYNLLCYYGLTNWSYEKFRNCHIKVKDKQKDAELVNVKAENEVLKAEIKVLKAKNKGEKKTDESATEEEQEELGSNESETEDTDKQLNTRMKNMRIKQNETETEKLPVTPIQYW